MRRLITRYRLNYANVLLRAASVSPKEDRPVPVEGSYRNEADREVLFRCVMIPVRAMNDAVDFVYGAYSLRIAT